MPSLSPARRAPKSTAAILIFAAPFLIENSRGLVPLSSLSALLPRFLGTPVNFRESARRLFIADVGIQPSFRLDAGNPPRLVLNFSAPVNPTISTEPGKLRMVFKRDPVVSPGSQSISFDNKVITHASYSENNGDAELDVAANRAADGDLQQRQKDDHDCGGRLGHPANTRDTECSCRTRTTESRAGRSRQQTSPRAITITTMTNVHRILAVVDPAHGGDERGAALTDTLAEKDVTLGFARLLRHELEIRGFAVVLLRDADTSSTLDQRAAAANVARAGIYISLHAVSQGSGARVYTALLPVEGREQGSISCVECGPGAGFAHQPIVSAAIVTEMQKREFPVRAIFRFAAAAEQCVHARSRGGTGARSRMASPT